MARINKRGFGAEVSQEIIDELIIIGGVIFEVYSIMIDNSIKNKLQDYNFNERLN